MLYLFLAEGFEETEALATLDIIRRSGTEIATVGIGRKVVTGSHGIPVTADVMDCEIMPDETCTGMVLPGGMPGTLHLDKSECVAAFVRYCVAHKLLIGAICAAPSVLGHLGVLQGRRAICYDGYECELQGAVLSNEPVCRDGNIITAAGAGVSIEFGLALVAALCGEDKANKIKESMKCIR